MLWGVTFLNSSSLRSDFTPWILNSFFLACVLSGHNTIHMTDHLLADGPYFAQHHTDTKQNDITSSSVQKHRDGNKWMEYRKKGDNIYQCDRQQSQQTIKLPNVRRERHHNEEENQRARWEPSRNVNMELPPTGTGSRGKTIKTFTNKLIYTTSITLFIHNKS